MLPKIVIGIIIVAIGIFTFGIITGKGQPPPFLTNPASQPPCPEPLVLQTPVDLTKVTAILYPGQVRGGDFKPHGGFRFDNSKFDEIEVRAAFDAKVTDGVRYIENGEVQYMFDFETPCGLRYRHDHLLILSPKLEEIAQKLPEAKENDSRTTRIANQVLIKKGEVVATGVGFKNGNVFVDFGVYDINKQDFLTRDNKKSALCWFDLLPASDSAKVKSLPPADSKSGSTSSLCK